MDLKSPPTMFGLDGPTDPTRQTHPCDDWFLKLIFYVNKAAPNTDCVYPSPLGNRCYNVDIAGENVIVWNDDTPFHALAGGIGYGVDHGNGQDIEGHDPFNAMDNGDSNYPFHALADGIGYGVDHGNGQDIEGHDPFNTMDDCDFNYPSFPDDDSCDEDISSKHSPGWNYSPPSYTAFNEDSTGEKVPPYDYHSVNAFTDGIVYGVDHGNGQDNEGHDPHETITDEYSLNGDISGFDGCEEDPEVPDDHNPITDESSKVVPAPSYRKFYPAVKEYHPPTDYSVLLGQGGRTNNHNKIHYRPFMLERQVEYRKLTNKEAKMACVKASVEAYQAINKECRFLEREEGTADLWYEVPVKEAYRKVGQFLRQNHSAEARKAKREKYSKATKKSTKQTKVKQEKAKYSKATKKSTKQTKVKQEEAKYSKPLKNATKQTKVKKSTY
jgi:hypothetical protein